MKISGRTKICGIIGDPIEHTVSPAMHNAAFEKVGLDYAYLAFHVKKEALGQAIEGMKALNMRGLNVTLPHKVAVIEYLDELDPLAEKIGAVNTIVNNGGILKGYNTDASGFLQALLARGVEPDNKNIVILGAGGASRAIAFILAERGARLTILNRASGLGRAREIAGRTAQLFEAGMKVLALNEENLRTSIGAADILVNATSTGMSPHSLDTPVPAKLLKSGLVVFDIIYNPVKTRLLADAEKTGAQAINGVEMLVWQGASAFEIWTDLKAPVEVMRKKAIEALAHEDY